MIAPGQFEKNVAALLRANGWYRNAGWRREADARAGGGMPPALSAGEAVDELIGRERAAAMEAGQ